MVTEDTCNDVMNEERRRMMLEKEKLAPLKRECPVPKPGGLIGQVLGVKKSEEEELTVQAELERLKKNVESK